MNNKAVGTIFCVIAAMLMSVRYLVTAVFMSGVSSWSAELFSAGLEYVGAPLKIAAIAALLVGIAFIAYDLYQEAKAKNDSEI